MMFDGDPTSTEKEKEEAVDKIRGLLEDCQKIADEKLGPSSFVTLTVRMAHIHAKRFLDSNS